MAIASKMGPTERKQEMQDLDMHVVTLSTHQRTIRLETSIVSLTQTIIGMDCQLILKSLNLSLFHASEYIHLSILLKLRASPKVFLNKIILFI